jgi:hypothetical protein
MYIGIDQSLDYLEPSSRECHSSQNFRRDTSVQKNFFFMHHVGTQQKRVLGASSAPSYPAPITSLLYECNNKYPFE